jgi:diadenosine tetraphosphate (Ap4A) HIT family hydrolase
MTTACDLCDLCESDGGQLIYKDSRLRVVLVDDAVYPGFCRVIWNGHVKEMTNLAPVDRAAVMNAVWAVESAMRAVMQPRKVNLASLGNMMSHVHWHVIPRYVDDAHFPSPVWAEARRTSVAASITQRLALLPQLRLAIMRELVVPA